MSLVVDTHSFIWFLARSSDLSSVQFAAHNLLSLPNFFPFPLAHCVPFIPMTHCN